MTIHGHPVVTKLSDAIAVWCESCGQIEGCQYWDLSKTRWLHQNGTGHKVRYLGWPKEALSLNGCVREADDNLETASDGIGDEMRSTPVVIEKFNITPKTCVLESTGSRYESSPGTFMLAYRGSIAHDMFVPSADPNSIDDIDLMGFVFGEPRHYFGLHEWGSRGTKEVKAGCYDVVLYEIRKAVSLLLQGNPNIMSMLWVSPEHTLIYDDAARRLREARACFLGKHVYNAFAGYAHQQMEKMETRDPAELREYLAVTAELKFRGKHPNHKGEKIPYPDTMPRGESRDVLSWGDDKLSQRLLHFQRKGENLGYMGDKRKQLVLAHGYDSKNAAHLIRLLRMCIEFMRTGEMLVKRPDAAELLDIKRGKWELSAIKQLADNLFADAKAAKNASQLPDEPDSKAAEALLIELVQEHLR